MIIQKHKRIFYPVGFISLLVLPWLCLWYLNGEKKLVFRDPRAMEIFMPDINAKPNSMFSIYNFPKRKNHTITLTGNNKEDKIKLEYIQLELRRILKENDSIHGLHVIFSDSAKYWTMIKLFDICNIENFSRYYLLKNDFFAAHVPIKKSEMLFEYDCFLCGDVQFTAPSRKVILFNQIKQTFRDSVTEKSNLLWPSGLLLLSMIFLSFRQLYLIRKQ